MYCYKNFLPSYLSGDTLDKRSVFLGFIVMNRKGHDLFAQKQFAPGAEVYPSGGEKFYLSRCTFRCG